MEAISSLRGQIWWRVGAVCPDALGGGAQSACFIILVLTCVCVWGGGTSVRLFYLQGMMYHSFSLERQ